MLPHKRHSVYGLRYENANCLTFMMKNNPRHIRVQKLGLFSDVSGGYLCFMHPISGIPPQGFLFHDQDQIHFHEGDITLAIS